MMRSTKESRQIELRKSLAIIRAAQFLKSMSVSFDKTTEHDQSHRVQMLSGLLSNIHGAIFKDWALQPNMPVPGKEKNAYIRQRIRAVIDEILCNAENGMFDGNGCFVLCDRNDLAYSLAWFYKKLRDIEPFEYGNKLAIDILLVSLSKIQGFTAVYGTEIDFRRLSKSAKRSLDEASDIDDLKDAFDQLLDVSRTPLLENKRDGHGTWTSSITKINNIPFLCYKYRDQDCLVTLNGGLVPLELIKGEIELKLSSNMQIAELPQIPNNRAIGYLPGTENLRNGVVNNIDGVNLEKNAAPLFCLSVNILSGLYQSRHIALEEKIKELVGGSASIFTLANNAGLKDRLISDAKQKKDADLEKSIDIAFGRLSEVTKILDAAKAELFNGKTPANNPEFFMSMGGAGAGKSAVEEAIKCLCGENYITASLDSFRYISRHHKLMIAAGHHGDDYIFVEPFANALRKWVADYAKEKKYNLLYDGTGIEFAGRYDKIIADFDNAGFNTNVVMVDIPLEEALKRVHKRFTESGRALPWNVVVGKHILAPESFLQAVEFKKLKKISLFANDAGPGEHYLVAESFDFTDKEINILQAKSYQNELATYFKDLINIHPRSTLKNMANNKDPLDNLISRMKGLQEGNVAYLIFPSEENYRVLAIYDEEKFCQMCQKATLNPNASSPDQLYQPPRAYSFFQVA